ncbi:hypothetical protein Q73A0000_05035 [Kaistella flava (ex Peng et al. 2021)]|uniref:RecBCD enzyme subunit RecB n=1 Tax=Kaistella flava (ex Peng et al. 2021) TaxID=2038776 RepID=A0A7M2Y6R7_9FLAO|nr:UvrD-helicase domain-containing protein [Kaistella flava (ex Peng et al. 2021)]QOW09776.1 hypothetical protein Q73A0000_05035 [Kaistella flava (ex Peng et al. 2021)]
MEEFKVESVDLSGANIIEASAGTGKTFSIAVLVVRLLVEKWIPIEKMLLVTFTESAAAELKERSIKFIREALLEIENSGSSGNEIIKGVVENALNNNQTSADIENRLRKALLNIDNAMMCTIHSFCQQTLNEFAFETNQIFGKELKSDISDIVTKHTNGFRRAVLNIINPELFEISELSNEKILTGIIKNALSGQKLHGDHAEVHSLLEYNQELEKIRDATIEYLQNSKDSMTNTINNYVKKGYGKASALSKIEDNNKLLIYFELDADKIKFDFNDLFPIEIAECKKNKQERDLYSCSTKNVFFQQAIDWILPKVKQELKSKNHFTFDDLIDQLHGSRDKDALKLLMRAKYDAIFLDEFQDTDKKQYAIFKEIFQHDPSKIIFYIGDPKQSIYAWRKADLNTYFEARNAIVSEKRFTMKTNFRSTTNYIDALNKFFLPNTDFDTFENGAVEGHQKIKYEVVKAKQQNAEGLNIDNKLLSPLTIIDGYKSEEEVNAIVRKTIRHLLKGDVTLNKKPLKPSNITILIRTNREGKTLKRILESENIPSVILDDSKVVQSAEANELLFILQAILNPKKAAIQKAFLTSVLGKKVIDLEDIDFDYWVEKFSTYQKNWTKDGIFVALNQVINDFNLIAKNQSDITKGHRILSNIRQLLELLQEKEQNNALTPNEVYFYLYNQTKSVDDTENKELSQRIESDEDAVKIVTIHKSKGLEYDVIIAPYLNLNENEKGEFSSIRIEKEGESDYVFTRKPISDLSLKVQFISQQNQENRRLLYVALTRAKYNAIVISKVGKSTLSNLLAKLQTTNNNIKLYKKEDIVDWNPDPITLQEETIPSSDKTIPKLVFADKNYNKMSYSFLSAHPSKSTKQDGTSYEKSHYDHFVFKDLKKGAQIGNLLHNIFEFINYSDTDNWTEVIRTSVQCFAPSNIEDTVFLENLYQLVHHTVHANLGTDAYGNTFSLQAIERGKRINEIEFNFKIANEFGMMDLESVMMDHSQILTKRSGDVKGMMNGLVDLFFEHEGKYYILDWKSNFLGDSIACYHADQLNESMNESNYHLQYCIYTVAMKRFVESKLGADFDYETHFGGVIYLFLRGVREGQSTGVYVNKLPSNKVEELERIFQLEAVM